MKRLAAALASVALTASCASVLGLSTDDFDDPLADMCVCDDVRQALQASDKATCHQTLQTKLDAQPHDVQVSWLEAYANCQGCDKAMSCLQVFPFCSEHTCDHSADCCPGPSGPKVCTTQHTCCDPAVETCE